MTERMRKIRFFPAWQDEQEEQWLEAMSVQGWHLAEVQWPMIYWFERGEPKPYAYRLDFQSGTGDKLLGYVELFEDAGWEHIDELVGWHYFRAERQGDTSPEIFTDVESKIGKYHRVLNYMLAFAGINLFLIVMVDDMPLWYWALALPVLIIYVVAISQLWARIKALEAEQL